MGAIQRAIGSVPNPFVKPDERTLDEYAEAVASWAESLRTAGADGFEALYTEQGYGKVELQVENRSTRFLSDVRVTIRFPWHEARGHDWVPDRGRLPGPPRAFGEPSRFMDTSSMQSLTGLHPTPISVDNSSIHRRTWVEDGSVKVTFDLGTLRPNEVDASEPFWIVLPSRPASGTLDGTWEATAHDIDAVITGVLTVPVAEEPVLVSTVLDAEFQADD